MSSTHSALSPQQANLNSPSITIVLTIVLLVFFFIGFFSIYFCRCFMDSVINSWHLQRTPSGNIINASGSLGNEGLDPSLILLFPLFDYSSVKKFKWENNFGSECSICLAEFEDDDSVRLISICYHVFHKECIDLWFKSHKTCPVCRSDLDLPRETLEKAQSDIDLPRETLEKARVFDHYNVNDTMHEKNKPILEHVICIDVRDDDDDDNDDDEEKSRGNGEEATTSNHSKIQKKNIKKNERFSRSHSTGHSIAMTREEEEEDKYSLRLLEHVNVKMRSGHNATESCIAFGEVSGLRYGTELRYSNGHINQV